MKKIISLTLVAILILVFAVACGPSSSDTINLVSREDGSGTRGAFVEIVGVEVDGNDATYEEAIIQNGTNGVMTTVAGDKYSIGYISLGSLNDTVTALSIDGVEASTENIKSGAYKIARPFNIAYKENLSDLAKDFVGFIMSANGQAIIADNSLIEVVDNTAAYSSLGLTGNIVVGGSTSVTPVMEKLAEAYEELNKGVSIEIQSTGSSAGMTAAIEGSADIGMASRDLKESEMQTLEYQAIGIDGIAVIVNNEGPVRNLSLEQVRSIYLGEVTSWSELE